MRVAICWHYEYGDACCDLNSGSSINIGDIMLVAVHWGEECE
jgi:hypothetical protein